MLSEAEVDDFYLTVGERVKAVRVRRNRSQSDLAKNVGMSRASIGNFERGRQRIQVHLLAAIAFELNVSVHTFLPPQIATESKPGSITSPRVGFTDDTSKSFVDTVKLLVESED